MKEFRVTLTELCNAAEECKDDLEGHLSAEYPQHLRDEQPLVKRRFDRDMECVKRLAALLIAVRKELNKAAKNEC